MIAYFARHPTAANLLMVVIILLGALGAFSLNREVFPDFIPNMINIQVIYKGASAEEVEETVTRRIEEEIEGIEGIAEVESVSREGVGIVTVEVADGYRVGEVLADLENAVDTIDNFPENVEEPILWEFEPPDGVCTVTLASEAIPEKDLLALADSIKDELLALDEVSLVTVTGFSAHQIRVEVRRQELLAQGLTIADVAGQIRAQSLDLPAGSVESDQREIKIRVVDQRRWAEEFRDLTVKVSPDGARIPLRAVATVTDSFEEDWTATHFHGRRAASLEVAKTDEQDTIQVADAVRAFVKQRKELLPSNVTMEMWGDYSFYVRDRLGMLVRNGLAGFVLVFFTLWLMLNLRLSFWVAVGIPISFLGTLWVMDQLDMSLNMITMFALILAVGIIVDDAIVIGENIYAHYSRGKSAVQAAIDGPREVALAVTASMLTTVAVFMPLLTMQGEVGKIMRVMPYAVVTALAVSLVEAFLILPHHLARSLHKIPSQPTRIRAAIDRFVAWFTRGVYGPVLDWWVRRPLLPLAGVIALLLVAVGLVAGGRIKFQLFPEMDGDFLIARVELPRGTAPQRTREIAGKVAAAAEAINDHPDLLQPSGLPLIKHVATAFGFSREMLPKPAGTEEGGHVAQVIVELMPADQRTREARCDNVLELWRQQLGPVPDVARLTLEQLQMTPGGQPINIQLRGQRLEELKRASVELQEKIATYPGIRNLSDNLRPGKEEVRVRLKPAAQSLGITSATLAMQLRNGFWGNIAEEFQRGNDTFEVKVRFDPADRRNLADLADFKVQTPTGQQVPFHEVATARQVQPFAQIVRVDRQRTASVTADLDTAKANAEEIRRDLEEDYFEEFLGRHPGVRVNLEGQSKESQETFDSVGRGFLIGLAMIFIILSFVFKSYLEPLIVMTAIPFGLIGAIFGHLVMGLDLTMPSVIGVVSLSGIVVNDSIVLVSFIKLRLAEGHDVLTAIHEAGLARFRAVFLTSATTLAGLLPMMLETSLQAQFLIPMAVSIAFGLMFATAMVLVLVPCLYRLLATLGLTQKIVPRE